jgi:nitrile hydratase subunit beta
VNGPQDLGGQMGFGLVAPEPEKDEPIFHEPWEARALALTLTAGALGHWNIDVSRHARESLPPAVYYGSSYYEIWTLGLERLLADAGLVGDDELAAGSALHHAAATARPPLAAAQVRPSLAAGSPYTRPTSAPPRFGVGQRVRTINDHPTGHTRLPRYARGVEGTVERVHGCFVFPDTNAAGDPDPQWCYTVTFAAADLWGRSADPRSTVSIDAFEPYLVPAS